MHAGRLGKNAYQASALRNPEILRLADAVRFTVDPTFPGPERFKGQVKITLANGQTYETIEEHNRGSAENPMSTADLVAKFEENVAGILAPARAKQLVAAIFGFEDSRDANALVKMSIGD
jgi:2-methylcitrate dehydratase PrpD